MSVRVPDLLTWAQNTSRSTEVGVRAAISRAYYACYHRCKEWHANLPHPGHKYGVNASTPGVHQQLINQLLQPSNHCSPQEQILSMQLGHALQNLKAQRSRADYDLAATLDAQDAAAAMSDARALIVRAVP